MPSFFSSAVAVLAVSTGLNENPDEVGPEVGLNPPVAGTDAGDDELELPAPTVCPPKLNPLTGAEGLKPPLVVPEAALDCGAGSLKEPAMGGAVVVVSGLPVFPGVSWGCLLASTVVSFTLGTLADLVTGFPAFSLISLSKSSYSSWNIFMALVISTKGSSLSLTSNALNNEVLSPRMLVRYSVSFGVLSDAGLVGCDDTV